MEVYSWENQRSWICEVDDVVLSQWETHCDRGQPSPFVWETWDSDVMT